MPLALLIAVGSWAFAPTVATLVEAWRTEPDYSHGFIVPLVALALLWARRATLPFAEIRWSWWGTGLVAASFVLRLAGALTFVEACDGWALVLWIAGIACLVFGPRVTWWAAPALVFLLFAIPLPYRVEHFCSQPLQRIATIASAWTLQTIGTPAFAEGNVIILGDHLLEVERACAGLRIFVGMIAAAFAWAVLFGRSLGERAVFVLGAIPIAVLANVVRIVVTALCFQYGSHAFATMLAHDAAGWLMVPLAIGFVALWNAYLSRLIVRETSSRLSDVVHLERV